MVNFGTEWLVVQNKYSFANLKVFQRHESQNTSSLKTIYDQYLFLHKKRYFKMRKIILKTTLKCHYQFSKEYFRYWTWALMT